MKGYIYKLSGGGKFYIGSTSLTPADRFVEHKAYSTKAVSQSQPVYRHFTTIGWENATVETLRECEYSVKRELLQFEREEYDKVSTDVNCLNVNRPSITNEELKQQVRETSHLWHQEHKEQAKERLQEWRKANPDKVKAQRDRRSEQTKEDQRVWYQQNKERKQEQVNQWRIANPEKYAEQKKRSIEQQRLKRQAMKNNVEVKTN